MDNIVINLVMTEDCNLACKYCYMKNRNSYMDYDVADAISNNIQKLVKFYNGKTFSIDFFGGEPMLNWDVIKYLVSKLNGIENKKHFCIISNMLLLDEDKVNYIRSVPIGASWSFDGLYNKDIRIENGTSKSTFDSYMDKLDMIKQLTPACKCTITPYHMKSKITLADNLKYMVNELGLIPDYTISRDGGWTPEIIKVFSEQLDDYADAYVDLCNNGHIIDRGFFNLYLADTIVYKLSGKRDFSCFAGQNGMSIMPNGDIYPCARYGSNRVDKMGTVFDADNLHNFSKMNELKTTAFEKCKHCDMRGWCNSGCQYSQQCNDCKPLNDYCTMYHIIYKKALEVFTRLRDNKQWLKTLHFESFCEG